MPGLFTRRDLSNAAQRQHSSVGISEVRRSSGLGCELFVGRSGPLWDSLAFTHSRPPHMTSTLVVSVRLRVQRRPGVVVPANLRNTTTFRNAANLSDPTVLHTSGSLYNCQQSSNDQFVPTPSFLEHRFSYSVFLTHGIGGCAGCRVRWTTQVP